VAGEGWHREVSPYPDHRPFSVTQLRILNGASCPLRGRSAILLITFVGAGEPLIAAR